MAADDPEAAEPVHRQAVGHVARWSSGHLLVLGPDGVHRRLTGAAGPVWSVLDRPGTATEVGERLAALGAEPAATAPTFVAETLATLAEQGLVVPAPPAGP